MIFEEEKLKNQLWQGTHSIALFVYMRNHYYVIDYKENFNLDIKKDIDLEYDNGEISKEEYFDELNSSAYRGGILELKANTFEQYLSLESVKQVNTDELRYFLFQTHDYELQNLLYEKVEAHLAYGDELIREETLDEFLFINQMSMKLPLFYINFDRKIYMHMNWDRSHESYSYKNWFSKADDFRYLVPDHESYWKRDGKDFWKVSKI